MSGESEAAAGHTKATGGDAVEVGEAVPTSKEAEVGSLAKTHLDGAGAGS